MAYRSHRSKTKDFPIRFSMSTISSFKSKQNKNGVNRDTDCMKKFFEILKRAHVTEIFNFKKKKNEFIDKRAA